VKSNNLALRKFGSNVSGLTKLTFFFNVPIKGVQEPEYRRNLASFSKSRSRTRSGHFWLKQDPDQEWIFLI